MKIILFVNSANICNNTSVLKFKILKRYLEANRRFLAGQDTLF